MCRKENEIIDRAAYVGCTASVTKLLLAFGKRLLVSSMCKNTYRRVLQLLKSLLQRSVKI